MVRKIATIINYIIFILYIFFFIDEDEIYDDKNFHSEEDDIFEIPDGKYFILLYHMFFIFFARKITIFIFVFLFIN